ncbi:MAG: hypothetical protein P9F75_00665 [Candidatus Contendobacter sp.]|nr:hypothetical protein [Candidatus Contendobacter sp.]
MTYEITEYNATAAAIAILRDKHAGPFDATTKEGMALAKEARAEVRSYRTSVEKLRAELKAPLLERGKQIDAEAKRITAELTRIEEPIDAAIKAEERRKEEEKAAKARAEAERVARINARLLNIRRIPTSLMGRPASEIETEIARMIAYQPNPEEFVEFLPEALDARNEVRAVLETMLIERKRADEEKAKIQAEREELERLRAIVAANPPAPPPELSAAPAPPTPSTKPNGRGKKAPALTPIQSLIATAQAGNMKIEDAIQTAYKMGYDDGVVAATTAK